MLFCPLSAHLGPSLEPRAPDGHPSCLDHLSRDVRVQEEPRIGARPCHSLAVQTWAGPCPLWALLMSGGWAGSQAARLSDSREQIFLGVEGPSPLSAAVSIVPAIILPPPSPRPGVGYGSRRAWTWVIGLGGLSVTLLAPVQELPLFVFLIQRSIPVDPHQKGHLWDHAEVPQACNLWVLLLPTILFSVLNIVEGRAG